MTSDQILPSAIVAVIVILVVVAVVRVARRRRPGPNEDAFGAGGVTTVEVGTRGVAKTDLTPAGVVRVVSEEWTARSADGGVVAEGASVRVVRQDGLTLIVEADPAGSPAKG